jgi:hypothetical protein
LADGGVGMDVVLKHTEELLNILADAVLVDLQVNLRKKYEHLLTELVHQRDVARQVSCEEKGVGSLYFIQNIYIIIYRSLRASCLPIRTSIGCTKCVSTTIQMQRTFSIV